MGRSADTTLARELAANHEAELAEKAQAHTDDAIDALARVMKQDVEPHFIEDKNGEPAVNPATGQPIIIDGAPAGPVVSAAKALIDYGHGKAASKPVEKTTNEITVNLIQFGDAGDETPVEKVVRDVVPKAIEAASPNTVTLDAEPVEGEEKPEPITISLPVLE